MKPVPKWGLTILVLIVLGGMLILSRGVNRGDALPSVPVPNGYDDFVAAGQLLHGDLNLGRLFATNLAGVHNIELEQLRTLVATNTETLRLFQLGLSRASVVPLAVFVTNQSRMMEDLATLKRLAQFNLAVGRLAELEGRTNEAVATHLQGMRFAAEAIRGGVVIHGLVGRACESMAFIPLTNLMTRTTSDQVPEIIMEFERIDATATSWKETIKWERIFMSRVAPFDGNPISWIRNWWNSRSILQKAEVKHGQHVAQRRRFLVELALRRYVAAHGKPPQKLDELIPDYLSRLPENPATKQPPGYQVQGTNWVLEFKR